MEAKEYVKWIGLFLLVVLTLLGIVLPLGGSGNNSYFYYNETNVTVYNVTNVNQYNITNVTNVTNFNVTNITIFNVTNITSYNITNITLYNFTTFNVTNVTIVNVTNTTIYNVTNVTNITLSNFTAGLVNSWNMLYKQRIDFESTTAGYTNIWIPTAIASGTAPVATAIDWTHQGIVNITVASGTIGSGYAFQQSNAAAFRLRNNSFFFTAINMQCQASSINITELRVGYQDVFTAAAPVDGIYFNITASNGTGGTFNVTPVARNNSVQTGGTVFTANCNEWYTYAAYVNNVNSVTYLIWNVNGTLVNSQTLTSNIAWRTGRETSSAIVGYTRGARYTTLGHSLLDYLEIGINESLVR